MPEEPTHWLYPVQPSRNDRVLDDLDHEGEVVAVTAQNLWSQITRHPHRHDEWVLASGHRSIVAGDCLWIYVSGAGVVAAVGVVSAPFDLGRWWEVGVDWDVALTDRLHASPITLHELGRHPQSVQRASGSQLDAISKWLGRKRVGNQSHREDVPSSVELRWRPGDHQAALTVSV